MNRSNRSPKAARFADHVTICSPVKDEEPLASASNAHFGVNGRSWEEQGDTDESQPSGDAAADSSPILIPNAKWHDVDEEVDENENFRLNRERLRNLLLADPVLQEKAQHFIETVLQDAQDRVQASREKQSYFKDEATVANEPTGVQEGPQSITKQQQDPNAQARPWAREALPSLPAIQRAMSGFFGGVSSAFQRFAASSENFLKNRRQQQTNP